MKRFLVTALSAGFLAGLVIGCNPPGGEKATHSSGTTEKEMTGKGGEHMKGITEKSGDSTKR